MHPEHRRELILDFIDRFVIVRKRGPTLAEIADELHITVGMVRGDLRNLRERGCVTWTGRTPYTLRRVK